MKIVIIHFSFLVAVVVVIVAVVVVIAAVFVVAVFVFVVVLKRMQVKWSDLSYKKAFSHTKMNLPEKASQFMSPFFSEFICDFFGGSLQRDNLDFVFDKQVKNK